MQIPATGFTYWLLQAMVSEAGGVMTTDNDKKVTFTDPAVMHALQYRVDLAKVHKAHAPGIVDWGVTPRDFLEGKAAMIWHTTGNLTNIRTNAKFPFGVGMLPVRRRGAGLASVCGTGVFHPRKPARRDLAGRRTAGRLAWQQDGEGSFERRADRCHPYSSAIPARLKKRSVTDLTAQKRNGRDTMLLRHTLLATAAATLTMPAVVRAQTAKAISFYYPIAVGGPLAATIDGYCKDFAKESGVEVNPVYAGNYSETLVKAVTAIKGGEGPHLAVLLAAEIHAVQDLDILLSLDELGMDQKWVDGFYPAFMANSRKLGKTWAAPFQRSTAVAYYNKQHFTEAGLDPKQFPTTWEGLIAAGRKLTKTDANGRTTRWGFKLVSDTGNVQWTFGAIANQAGLWRWAAQLARANLHGVAGDDGGGDVEGGWVLHDLLPRRLAVDAAGSGGGEAP